MSEGGREGEREGGYQHEGRGGTHRTLRVWLIRSCRDQLSPERNTRGRLLSPRLRGPPSSSTFPILDADLLLFMMNSLKGLSECSACALMNSSLRALRVHCAPALVRTWLYQQPSLFISARACVVHVCTRQTCTTQHIAIHVLHNS